MAQGDRVDILRAFPRTSRGNTAGDTVQDSPENAAAADAAAKCASAAAQSAEAAKASALAARSAADSLRAEFNDARKDRTLSKRQIRIAQIGAFLTFCTLVAIAWQGWSIQGQLDAANRQLELAQATGEFTIVSKLREGTLAIQDLVDQSGGIFDRARKTRCHPLPDEPLQVARQRQFVIAHYEVYFEALKRKLISEQEWISICSGARELFQQNCLLGTWWAGSQVEGIDPAFRVSFIPSCTPPN